MHASLALERRIVSACLPYLTSLLENDTVTSCVVYLAGKQPCVYRAEDFPRTPQTYLENNRCLLCRVGFPYKPQLL
uniref:Uncharacterized protein n=2 Tax=Picea TaxID=3328 RepID=A0A101M030_PICGL|nr:hypothetical protein ABT39_MTgene4554 [Picea glauca]QHR87861.1 hypothetical protein Q903MT_gene1873 [Picea sitchensis]QHR92743.1 hypothetical protein Q903MT_gene6791 [Picea sitchensis]